MAENDEQVPLAATESVYTRAELMAGAEAAFGVTPETVAGALHLAGLAEATRTQTQAAIDAFLKREV